MSVDNESTRLTSADCYLGVKNFYLDWVIERSGTYHLNLYALHDAHVYQTLLYVISGMDFPYDSAFTGKEIVNRFTFFIEFPTFYFINVE